VIVSVAVAFSFASFIMHLSNNGIFLLENISSLKTM